MHRLRLLALMVAFSAAGTDFASTEQSQPPPGGGPPVAVGGWRYEKAASDVHVFHCEQASCDPSSAKVSYRFYPPNNPMTLEQFRNEQVGIVKALEQRSPGTKIMIVSVDGDPGTAVPRTFSARRLSLRPNGSQEYLISGILIGSRSTASLISSSRDEKITDANYAQFLLPLMLFIQRSGS
jgi:hypothetical protein